VYVVPEWDRASGWVEWTPAGFRVVREPDADAS
jgi:hypothetical protein